MDNLTIMEDSNDFVNSYNVPGLEESYLVYYSYSTNSSYLTITSDSKGAFFSFSSDGLRKESVEISVIVSVEAENIYSGSFTRIYEFQSYREYISYILAKEYHIPHDMIINNKSEPNVSSIYRQTIRSGHFYNNYYYTVDFNNNTATFYLKEFEKGIDDPYNIHEYEAIYYFGDGNPRIEGLTTGTYYVDGSSFKSDDSKDLSAYSYATKVNDVFKRFKETEFISGIS